MIDLFWGLDNPFSYIRLGFAMVNLSIYLWKMKKYIW